jgi:hypothetical protein
MKKLQATPQTEKPPPGVATELPEKAVDSDYMKTKLRSFFPFAGMSQSDDAQEKALNDETYIDRYLYNNKLHDRELRGDEMEALAEELDGHYPMNEQESDEGLEPLYREDILNYLRSRVIRR